MEQAIDTLRIFTRLKKNFTEDQAQDVTQALSEIVQDKFEKLEQSILTLDRRITALEQKFIKLQGEMTLVKWMLGFNLALSSAILVKLLTS